MRQRISVLLSAVVLIIAEVGGYSLFVGLPDWGKPSDWVYSFWLMLISLTLLGIIYFIIGIVLVTSREVAPGSIGTEVPVEVPAGYLSKQYRGGSYILAASLLLGVGLSAIYVPIVYWW